MIIHSEVFTAVFLNLILKILSIEKKNPNILTNKKNQKTKQQNYISLYFRLPVNQYLTLRIFYNNPCCEKRQHFDLRVDNVIIWFLSSEDLEFSRS